MLRLQPRFLPEIMFIVLIGKDQFCQPCFEKYVQEIIRNSWGLTMQPILCPVCLVELEIHDWERVLILIVRL